MSPWNVGWTYAGDYLPVRFRAAIWLNYGGDLSLTSLRSHWPSCSRSRRPTRSATVHLSTAPTPSPGRLRGSPRNAGLHFPSHMPWHRIACARGPAQLVGEHLKSFWVNDFYMNLFRSLRPYCRKVFEPPYVSGVSERERETRPESVSECKWDRRGL